MKSAETDSIGRGGLDVPAQVTPVFVFAHGFTVSASMIPLAKE